MKNQVRCNLCGVLVTRTSSFCENCGSALSTGKIMRSSFQDTGFERVDTYKSRVPSTSKVEPGVVLGTPNFFLDFILNVFYFIISYGIIQTTLNLNPSPDLTNLFGNRLSQNDINVLIGLWELIALSMIKGYLVIKIAPPEPYPAGWQLPNTIFGIILLPIFFIGIPYFILGLPLAILVTLIVLIWFFNAPYKQRKNPTTRMSRMKSLETSRDYRQETSSEYFLAKDDSDSELTEPTDESLIRFHIQKSGNFEVTYNINYKDNREYIVAFRTARNRLAVYAMFAIAFFFPPLLVLLLLLLVVQNKWILVRHITILDQQGERVGSIKGNLYFSYWKVSDLRGQYNASLKFSLVGHRGEIKTPSTSLFLYGDSRRTDVVDSQKNLILSVNSPESIYVRKKFSIESNDQLDPFLVATLSVCIIERFYKPQSQSN